MWWKDMFLPATSSVCCRSDPPWPALQYQGCPRDRPAWKAHTRTHTTSSRSTGTDGRRSTPGIDMEKISEKSLWNFCNIHGLVQETSRFGGVMPMEQVAQ